MLRRYAVATAIGLALPLLDVRAQGPAGSLAGTVSDRSGRPVVAAEVQVTALAGASPLRVTRTDETGRFAVPALSPGDYSVLVRRVGFMARQIDVVVTLGERTELAVILAPSAPVLDTVRSRVSQNTCDNRTLNGFECRRQAGVGYYRDAEELAALAPEQLFDLFRNLPGIRQRMTRSPFGGFEFVPDVRPSRCLLTLVNGRPAFGHRWWSARDVIGVEYYDSWQKVPLDFRQIADNVSCDLIVYWLSNAAGGEP